MVFTKASNEGAAVLAAPVETLKSGHLEELLDAGAEDAAVLASPVETLRSGHPDGLLGAGAEGALMIGLPKNRLHRGWVANRSQRGLPHLCSKSQNKR